MQLNCKIFIDSKSDHLQQIYTGFSELQRKQFVNLELIKKDEFAGSSLLKVIINNQFRVIYDTADGFNYRSDQGMNKNLSYLSKVLTGVDFYFKRSYNASLISAVKGSEKVYPLGLNYMVSSESNFGETISINFIDQFKRLIKRNKKLSKLLGVTGSRSLHIEQFEDYPRISENPKILFMARVWDPKDCLFCNPDDVATMNEMRANCIRLCRKEFGNIFVGGLAINEYAIEKFSDCLLSDNEASEKHEFLKRIKKSDICIATTGLHNSIGWKFGEYVAASKAIVSEKLHYELPGGFAPRKNYLEFTTPEECAQAIYELITNQALRFNIMRNNFKYYHASVRPDMLIMNTLLTVLEKSHL